MKKGAMTAPFIFVLVGMPFECRPFCKSKNPDASQRGEGKSV